MLSGYGCRTGDPVRVPARSLVAHRVQHNALASGHYGAKIGFLVLEVALVFLHSRGDAEAESEFVTGLDVEGFDKSGVNAGRIPSHDTVPYSWATPPAVAGNCCSNGRWVSWAGATRVPVYPIVVIELV
jgi:hypothetical protein